MLPLVPLYIGYLAGGAKSVDADGTVRYKRGRVMRNTVFFVLGVSFTFFALGLGFTALGRFFSDNRALFARIGGVVIILLGLVQIGFFELPFLQREVQKEPKTALDGGADGLIFYRAICDIWAKKLHPNGVLAVEIGETQGQAVKVLFEAAGLRDVRIHKDLGALDRAVSGVR